MNSQFTINPVLRSILLIMGFAGFASLMFFNGTFLYAKEIALIAIIPFLFGLLGENLLFAFFYVDYKILRKTESVLQSVVTPLPGNPNTDDQTFEKVA